MGGWDIASAQCPFLICMTHIDISAQCIILQKYVWHDIIEMHISDFVSNHRHLGPMLAMGGASVRILNHVVWLVGCSRVRSCMAMAGTLWHEVSWQGWLAFTVSSFSGVLLKYNASVCA